MTETNRTRMLASTVASLDLDSDESATADTLIGGAVELVPDVDWASITVRAGRGDYETIAATSAHAAGLDALQYELQEGPCLDATSETEWCRSGSVRSDARWPTWGPRAADLGAGSLLAVQLASGSISFGALNMYGTREDRFRDRDEIEFAVLYGAHVAVALATARHVDNLNSAIASRHSIGLAQGILMEKFNLTVEQSFGVLRRYSSDMSMKLAAVAAEVVATRGLPASPPETSDIS